MTDKQIELIRAKISRELGFYGEVGKQNFRVWTLVKNELRKENPADVVVKTKIAERIYKKLAIECLKKMEAPEFAALEIINAELDEEDKEIMADIAKII